MDPVCTEDLEYHNHKILVVDNNQEHIEVLTNYLANCGFQIISAQDGETAIQLAKKEKPDLILLDAFLPGIDGFQTCHHLKADPQTSPILVIFMTEMTQTENKLRGFDLGAVDYIPKPCQQEELLARVTTHLKLKDLTQNLEQRVEQQTTALTQTNKQLHQKIDQSRIIEDALRASESRYRAMIENSFDGIAIFEAGKIVFFNEKLLHIFKYTKKEDLVGKSLEILFHPDEKKRIRQYNQDREASLPAPEQYVARGLTLDGNMLYLRISATRIVYQDKTAVLGFFKDITRHKQLEGQLQQAQKMEAIGTLAGGIAHDFNNILNIIIGHTEMALLDDSLKTEVQEYLSRVMDASQRATDLVNQILTFSHQKGIEVKPSNISSLVKETIKMLKATLPSSIEIRQQIKDRDSLVMTDSTQIHQVLMNLCTNAAHAVPNQGGVLEVSLERVDIDQTAMLDLLEGSYLKLSVSDNGQGMDSHTLSRIFEPYFTTKKAGEGTGLGLAVVHGIITHYKGSIKVNSIPGEGTQFHVYLPITEQPPESQLSEKSMEELPRGNEHILFVDDEEMVVTLYQDMIAYLGYRITATSSSLKAWEMFKENPTAFDLIITDLTMPELSGDMLAKKAIALNPDMPIILCTGYSNLPLLDQTDLPGVCQHLVKPIILDQLAFTIREVIDSRK